MHAFNIDNSFIHCGRIAYQILRNCEGGPFNFSFVIPQYIILTSNSVARIFLPSTVQGSLTSDLSSNILANLHPNQLFVSADQQKFLEGRIRELNWKITGEVQYCAFESLNVLGGTCSEVWRAPPSDSIRTAYETEKRALQEKLDKTKNGEVSPLEVAVTALFGIIFGIVFIVAAFFLFMALAIMLIYRTIQLWLLMIPAPILPAARRAE